MAFSGGTFSRLYDWTTDRDNGVKILASRMDQEFDGMATGLSTCILKDGTQTCTAAIPFAEGLTVPDNKTIILGTNSDITIQYDESTNDSLEIAANVEGAALGIVLKADQGDDNADQHKVGIADGGTLTMASKISGSFVSYLTHTPNSTVASSTTAVAGNLTVGGDLTLGSGAVISEAELEKLDGITNGTVAADKAVVVDSNKDIASFRNVTLTGELDAGSLDISGDADIDGTLEADAMTLNGTAITATATLDTGISNNNVPKFTSGVADDDFLRVAGTAIEGRSAAEVLSDIAAAPAAGSSNIVTTGALNSGSITSGFGAIDNGASAITTTGVITGGSLDVDNININGNTISSTDTNGNITVDPNGSGQINLSANVDVTGAMTVDGLTVDGAAQINAANAYLALTETDTTNLNTIIRNNGGQFKIQSATDALASTERVLLDHATGDISFYDSTGVSQGLYWDASTQALGLGTTTPSEQLSLYAYNANNAIQVQSHNSTPGSYNEASLKFALSSSASSTLNWDINAEQTALTVDYEGSEKFRITSGGSVLVATITVPSANATSGAGAMISSLAGIVQNYSGNGAANYVNKTDYVSGTTFMYSFRVNGTACGTISSTNGTSTSYNTSSDYRLKENVTADWDATTRLKQLNPVRFNFIADADTTVDGFLAHEVQSVVPEAITGTHNEVDDEGNPVMQGIDQSKIVPLLVKTIQELEARIAALEAN